MKLKLLLSVTLLVAFLLTGASLQKDGKAVPTSSSKTIGQATYKKVVVPASAAEIIEAVNVRRIAENLPQLSKSRLAQETAEEKCNDMVAQDYWSHYSPSNVSAINLFQQKNIVFKKVGENLYYHKDLPTSESVVASWMESKSHKEAILQPVFEKTGVAICFSENYQSKGKNFIIVQHFFSD